MLSLTYNFIRWGIRTAAEVERRRSISIGTERKDLISRSTNILMLLHCPEVTDNHLPVRIILRIITMFKIGAENLLQKLIMVKIGTWYLLKEAVHPSTSVKNVLDAVSFY
jgi:3-dehydroquinate synthetase